MFSLHGAFMKLVQDVLACVSDTDQSWQVFSRGCCNHFVTHLNTLRPRQDGRHFADDIFTCIFFNENCYILIKFSLKYARKGPIDNNPALVQIMAWRLSGGKPLSEPMMISLPTHICVTRPQWVKGKSPWILFYHTLSVIGPMILDIMGRAWQCNTLIPHDTLTTDLTRPSSGMILAVPLVLEDDSIDWVLVVSMNDGISKLLIYFSAK